MNNLTILGIETSCDETAASVVHRHEELDGSVRGEILSNIVRSQLEEHAAYGGVVPEIAARAHADCLDHIIRTALSQAELTLDDLDAVAATTGPGLIGGLLVGMMTGKAIAAVKEIPFLPINHLAGHALTVGLTNNQRPPYLLLLVSGGHTQLISVEAIGQYKRIGSTIDDALGEAFDKTAKLLSLEYPGGPAVEKWAERGDPHRFDLPRPLKGRKDPNFSFSGLKTALRQQAQKCEPLSNQDISDLCASFQHALAESVTDRVNKALDYLKQQDDQKYLDTLVVAGGVAANKYLRSRLEKLTGEKSVKLVLPPLALCTDNAAMIAWAGAEEFAAGLNSPADSPARARWPLDENAIPLLGSGKAGAKA